MTQNIIFMCVILFLSNASVLGAPLENANNKEITVEGKTVLE